MQLPRKEKYLYAMTNLNFCVIFVSFLICLFLSYLYFIYLFLLNKLNMYVHHTHSLHSHTRPTQTAHVRTCKLRVHAHVHAIQHTRAAAHVTSLASNGLELRPRGKLHDQD